MKIAYIIFIKVPINTEFQDSVGTIVFFNFISDILRPHKITCMPACSAYFSVRRHFAIQGVVLVSVKRKILRDYQIELNETSTVLCHE